MLVQCPKCKTKYKVSDDVVKDASPAFRCSRCKHTFELEIEDVAERYVRPTKSMDVLPQSGKEESELSFTFPAHEVEPLREQEKKLGEALADKIPVAGSERKLADSWSMNDATPKHDEPFVFSDDEPPPVDENHAVAPDDATSDEPDAPAAIPEAAPNVYSMTPYRDQHGSTGPFLTLFALLIVFFSFAAAYYEAHPQASEKLVQRIPLVGSSVLKNNHLKQAVMLQSLQADYLPIQGNREVFVVSGVALNRNPVVIREVRIAGQLYNQEGKQIEQQTIWIGNAISPKIVRGMTAQDISDLQRLKPLKSFEIPPGDSVPFTIVFLKPSKTASNFSCEIVSAEAET